MVESKEGNGAIFSFYLPATREEPVKKTITSLDTFQGHGRILVLDDENVIRVMITSVLKKIGYEPLCVTDGESVIKEYEKALQDHKPFIVVILDATIPGGPGAEEIIPVLRKIDPDVKAILSSGYTGELTNKLAFEKGFTGVLPKPYTIDKLVQCLQAI
jgi:CheY-like chemotaxis protein